VRQALGARPYDEVFLLVQSLDQQREQQDNPPPPAPEPEPDKVADPGAAMVDALRVRRPRTRKANGAALPGTPSALPS